MMPNLLDFAYSAGTLPLPEQVSVVLADSCPQIYTIKVWEDNISTGMSIVWLPRPLALANHTWLLQKRTTNGYRQGCNVLT